MTSRLSSLLVRDGVISVKRMEKAFQRQVLFGGGLDTILLEMGEITEQRLLQYLSLATGLPPATPHELEVLDPRAAEVCPKDLAGRFTVVPLTFDGDALRVLARDPVDIAGLEDLASELEVPVQPFVAPEFRWELTFDRAFGRPSDERFVRVADLVRAAAPVPAVGKPQTVVVDAGLGALQAPSGARKTLIFSGVAMRQEMQRRRRRPSSVPDGIVSEIEPEITPPEISMELPDELGGGVVERVPPHDTQRVPFVPSDSRGSEIASGEISEAEALAAAGRGAALGTIVTEPPPRVVTGPMPVPAAPVTSASGSVPIPVSAGAVSARRPAAFDPSPITAAEARALLASAEHRDQVFEVLLRAIRGRAWYASVLTVQGGAAIGRVAVAGDEIDHTSITQVLIPLDSPSTFRQAVHTASPYIGPIATGDSEIDAMIKRMGGVVPPSALLLPLVLKNRVVALLVGHRGADTLRVTEVSELLPLAGVAGDALGRIIMRGKGRSGSVSTPPAPQGAAGSGATLAPVPQEVDEGPTGRLSGMARLSRPEVVAAARPIAASFGTVDELMAAVQALDDEKGMELAIAEALTRAPEVLARMSEHFPGTLKVDRFDLGGRHLKAAQHGPVLDLVVRLGNAAAELLMEKMRDGRKEVRYYATLCASESRPDICALPLVERLFDPDYGVREVALEGLKGYPARSLDDALEVARRALHSEDLDKIKAAASALAELADVRAIPDLLDVHGRGGDAAVAVGKALIGLTKQDFGINNKKWRQWWDKNRRKNRIEWLLDGLAARDPEIRRSSAEDLRKATGEYFGYHHDLPKREREVARQRWTEWWNQTGRLRFLPPEEHERNRPTAVLPPRRSP
ncbi:MAG TPA: hypothetical protein VFU21_26405 [Kofleriaceae bacterium]|nr:hypothetical protein [Kofleriaceae bacterium]